MAAQPHPQRIVALAPQLTELCLALGCAERLVGVSDYCALPERHPAERLGGPGNPDIARLRALRSDVVLLDLSPGGLYGQPDIPADLPVLALRARSVASLIEQIAELGAEIGAPADALCATLRQATQQAEQRQLRLRMRRAALFTWADPWLAVGGDCYLDDLLRLCMAENIALRMPGRSPRAGLDAFMRYNPQAIMLAGDPGDAAALAPLWRFGDVSAVMRRRVTLIDRLVLGSYVRMPEAIAALTDAIHRRATP